MWEIQQPKLEASARARVRVVRPSVRVCLRACALPYNPCALITPTLLTLPLPPIGVGGWDSAGVDPALYSKALMSGAQAGSKDEKMNKDPVKLMQQGYV